MRYDPSLLPEKPSRDEMVALQREIAESAVFGDDFEGTETVAGVD